MDNLFREIPERCHPKIINKTLVSLHESPKGGNVADGMLKSVNYARFLTLYIYYNFKLPNRQCGSAIIGVGGSLFVAAEAREALFQYVLVFPFELVGKIPRHYPELFAENDWVHFAD